jgi:hypothetical protein
LTQRKNKKGLMVAAVFATRIAEKHEGVNTVCPVRKYNEHKTSLLKFKKSMYEIIGN